MITDVPSAADFNGRSKSLLHLAWEVTLKIQMHHVRALDLIEEDSAWSKEEIEQQTEKYWELSQPELQNAHALIHQAVEMALKARICSVSPFLLIARDARDYPARSDQVDTPFSRFRTIDTSDLLRVANSVCPTRLDNAFESAWNGIREERNANIHSVPGRQGLRPIELVRNILFVNELLHGGTNWTRERGHYLMGGHRDTAYEPDYYDWSTSQSLLEMEAAIALLTPSECLRSFGFRKKDRSFLCPICESGANKHERGNLPHFAQLVSKDPSETQLRCAACEAQFSASRTRCHNAECKGNVISEWPDSRGQCLTCGTWANPTGRLASPRREKREPPPRPEQ